MEWKTIEVMKRCVKCPNCGDKMSFVGYFVRRCGNLDVIAAKQDKPTDPAVYQCPRCKSELQVPQAPRKELVTMKHQITALKNADVRKDSFSLQERKIIINLIYQLYHLLSVRDHLKVRWLLNMRRWKRKK